MMKRLLAALAVAGALIAHAHAQTFPGVQSGATCPTTLPLASPFANTAGAPTGTTLNIWDGAQCVPWATLNATAHALTFTSTVANAAPIWQRATSVSANGIPYAAIVNQNPLTGGVGGANYTNEVVAQGWNVGPTVGIPFLAGTAMNFDTWESKFFSGGGATTYVVERHMTLTDTAGTQHRFFTAQLPWDGLGNASGTSVPAGLGLQFDYINFLNWAGSQVIKWNLFGNVAQVNNGFFFNFNANNYVPLRQFNAANSAYVNLPWVDSGNNLRFDAPSIFGSNGGTTGSIGIFGATSGAATLTTGATGGHLSVVQAGSGTPTLTAGCNGAGSVVSGNDTAGTITGQTAAATSCTLTFGTAYASAPNCVASGQSSPLTGAFTPSTTGIVVNFASTANYKWSYICFGA